MNKFFSQLHPYLILVTFWLVTHPVELLVYITQHFCCTQMAVLIVKSYSLILHKILALDLFAENLNFCPSLAKVIFQN